MRALVIVVALCALGTAACGPGAGGSPEAATITPAALQSRLESSAAPLVVDVRTREEYASGHIPGALNIPFDEIPARLSELEAPNGVAVYCMVGPRARKAEAALLSAGHRSVLHLEGGFAAWQSKGLPVEGMP